jgi:hypothetical protein
MNKRTLDDIFSKKPVPKQSVQHTPPARKAPKKVGPKKPAPWWNRT